MFLLVYSGDHNHMHIFISLETSVLDPDLEIRGGGGAVSKKNFQIGLRIGGEQVPRAPPVDLDPLLNLPV